jgi:cell division protein FtsQ
VNLRAARRHVDRRRQQRPRGSVWPGLLGCLIVFAAASPWLGPLAGQGWLALQRQAGLVVAELQVDGARRVADATILEALGVEAGMPILAVDVHAARVRLEELAWVETAAVRRRLPRRLAVTIREHRPLAVWFGPEGSALLAASGAAIDLEAATPPAGLPVVVGADVAAHAGEIRLILEAAAAMDARVTRLERTGAHRWRLRLARGTRIELPPVAPLAAMARLEALQAETGLLDRAVAAVDLRVRDRLVVTPLPILKRAEAS